LPKQDKFLYDNIWQSVAQNLSKKGKTKCFQTRIGGNACFELTHLLQSHDRVNWIFLWYFSEFLPIRCVWPKLDKLLYDSIWQSSAQNRSKEGKTKWFQTCSSCNACFEFTHLLQINNRVFNYRLMCYWILSQA